MVLPPRSQKAMAATAMKAVECAICLINELDEVDIDGIPMRVHVGLSWGPICSYAIGGVYGKWEHLTCGRAIEDLGPALSEAKAGEIGLSEAIYDILKLMGTTEEVVFPRGAILARVVHQSGYEAEADKFSVSSNESPHDRVKESGGSHTQGAKTDFDLSVFRRGESARSSQRQSEQWEQELRKSVYILGVSQNADVADSPKKFMIPNQTTTPARAESGLKAVIKEGAAEGTSRWTERLVCGVHCMIIRLHLCLTIRYTITPLTQINTSMLRTFVPSPILSNVEAARSGWLMYFRPVTVLFLKISREVLQKDLESEESRMMELDDLQFLYSRLQKILFTQQATIKELTQDDKGIVMVAGFGIPPAVHDDEPTRAVKSAVAIAQLMEEAVLDFSIGITTGHAFVASIGSKERREFAMIGPNVNLAARLMCLSNNPGILVEETTKTASEYCVEYETLGEVKVKGKEENVHIYMPIIVHKRSRAHSTATSSRSSGRSSTRKSSMNSVTSFERRSSARSGSYRSTQGQKSDQLKALEETSSKSSAISPVVESATTSDADVDEFLFETDLYGNSVLREEIIGKLHELWRMKSGCKYLVVGQPGMGRQAFSRSIAEAADSIGIVTLMGFGSNSLKRFNGWHDIFDHILLEVDDNNDEDADSFKKGDSTDTPRRHLSHRMSIVNGKVTWSVKELMNKNSEKVKTRLSEVLSGDQLEYLALLNDALGTNFPESKASSRLTKESVRLERACGILLQILKLFLKNLLPNMKTNGRLVIIFDAAKHLDSESALLLERLMNDIISEKILFLFTAECVREKEVLPEKYERIHEMLLAPEQKYGIQKRSLQPMSAQEYISYFFRAVPQRPLCPYFGSINFRRTGGIPAFVGHSIMHLQNHKAFKKMNKLVSVDMKVVEELETPPEIVAKVLASQSVLSAREQLIASVCSVCGTRFSYDMLEAAYPVESDKERGLLKEDFFGLVKEKILIRRFGTPQRMLETRKSTGQLKTRRQSVSVRSQKPKRHSALSSLSLS